MKMIKNNKLILLIRCFLTNTKVILLLTISCVFIVLFSSGYIFQKDSIGYDNMHPIRTMGYPLIVQFFKLFSSDHYLDLLFVFQLTIGIVTIYFIAIYIVKWFEINYWYSILIAFLLILPYIFKLRIGSHIYTEPVAYPLFLFFIIWCRKYYSAENVKNIVRVMLILVVLTIIRSQFIFIFPVLFLLFVIQLVLKRITYKKAVLYTTILLLSYGTMNLIDCSYHYLVHKKFVRTPFTGIQLLTEVIFVSEESDTVLFDIPEQKEAFRTIMLNVKLEGYDKKSFMEQSSYVSKDNINNHYRNTYNPICWGIIEPIFHDQYNLDEKNIQGWVKLDKLTINISKTLLKHRYSDYFINQFIDIYFYGFYPHIGLIFSLIFIFILAMNLKNHRITGFLLFLFLLDFSNIILCSLIEPLLLRYLFYTKIILFTFFISFTISVFKNKSNQVKSNS